MQRHYLFLGSHGHFGNGHGIVAEDVHHLDGDLAPPRPADRAAGGPRRSML
jgi:hypothetical protein